MYIAQNAFFSHNNEKLRKNYRNIRQIRDGFRGFVNLQLQQIPNLSPRYRGVHAIFTAVDEIF